MGNNIKKKVDWSVVLLTAVGIILITIAGSVFISSTWKLLSEASKEICLSAITLGAFVLSHYVGKKKNLNITGRALFYLGVVATGFTSYMLFHVFEDILYFDLWNIRAIKFASAVLLMVIELAYLYFTKRKIVDLCFLYIMSNLVIASYSIGFELSGFVTFIIFGIESVLLAINSSILASMKDKSDGIKDFTAVTYLISLFIQTVVLFFYSVFLLFASNKEFGKLTTISLILFASALVYFIGRVKNNYNSASENDLLPRLAANIWGIIFCIVTYSDIASNLNVIPNYYMNEVLYFVIVFILVLTNLLWHDVKNSKILISGLTFVIACITSLSLLGHCAASEHLACVLTLGISAVLVLIISSLKNNQKYQVLSGICLTLLTLYTTRTFWLSVAWWVYLLIAGIVCILIAILREKRNHDDDLAMEKINELAVANSTLSEEITVINNDIPLDFIKNN